MAPAATTVFSTPKLLEAILLQLPIRDLLVTAPLINRYFQAAILSSRGIQEALFLCPESRKQQQHPSYSLNPLLRKAFAPWFILPLPSNRFSWSSDEEFKKLDWDSSPKRRQAYARKEASWRRMLVAQPPVTALNVKNLTHAMRGNSEREGRLEVEDGLRMGPLYDLVQKSVGVPISSFAVKWSLFPEGTEGDFADSKDEGDRGNSRKSVDAPESRSKQEELRGDVTLLLHHTVQCCVGMPNTIGPKFKSEGYEDVEIKFGDWVKSHH